ncbi:hypothetical protein [Lentzea sp. E54]|uniref:hypothetical protein n=1 Tax=Lentzea xerophila TaxID=3435883 RepID=UPI003DA4F426
MTTPDELTCLVCAEPYGERRPRVRVDPRCSAETCLPCLENLVRQSCVPTVVTTASDDEVEWGQLPAGVTCPFCRAELDQADLARLGIGRDLLDTAFAQDRSHHYYRYAGQAWQAYVPRPFTAQAEQMPLMDDGVLPAVYGGDTVFMPAVNSALRGELDAYNSAVRELRASMEISPPLNESEIEELRVYFDALTCRITSLCAARSEVVDRFLVAGAENPDDVAIAHHNGLGAMRSACMQLQLSVEEQLPGALATLAAVPCLQVWVPDVLSLRETMGQTSVWFEISERIHATNAYLAEVWTALRAQAEGWTRESDTEHVLLTLRAIDESDVRSCMADLENTLWCCVVMRQENEHITGRIAYAREVLGLAHPAALPV